MTNLLPRAAARIHAMTEGKQWDFTDWHGVAAIAHAARQHQINQRQFIAAEEAYRLCSVPAVRRRLDLAQSAVRASAVILERLLGEVEG